MAEKNWTDRVKLIVIVIMWLDCTFLGFIESLLKQTNVFVLGGGESCHGMSIDKVIMMISPCGFKILAFLCFDFSTPKHFL